MAYSSADEAGGKLKVTVEVASKLLWVRGPRLPEEVEESGLLTPEDHQELTLDHMERTSEFLWKLEIHRRS